MKSKKKLEEFHENVISNQIYFSTKDFLTSHFLSHFYVFIAFVVFIAEIM